MTEKQSRGAKARRQEKVRLIFVTLRRALLPPVRGLFGVHIVEPNQIAFTVLGNLEQIQDAQEAGLS